MNVKKCPNCGQKTILSTSRSCQWCGWPIDGKYAKNSNQENGTWLQGARSGLISGAILILAIILIAAGFSGWDWSVVPTIFERLWLVILVASGLAVMVTFLVVVTPGKLFFIGLYVLGSALLFASFKNNPVIQPLANYIQKSLDLNLFSTSIAILSLALAVGVIAGAKRRY